MINKHAMNLNYSPDINNEDFIDPSGESERPTSSEGGEATTKNKIHEDDYNDEIHSDDHIEHKEGMDEETAEEIKNHEEDYSDEGFWDKVTKYAKKAGETTLSPALKLYYTAEDPDTPTWAKSTIYGALGYFISPIDALPDVTPVLGYTDDIGILAGAIAIVVAHIKDEHAEKAKETLKRWFS